jgi:RND family efflux transporter MFP subunit
MQERLSAFRWIGTAIGPAALAACLAACSGEAEAPVAQAAQTIPLVETQRAVSTSVSGAIRASGLVGYKRETALSFGAPGEIETLSVDAGDKVFAGQQLATLRRTTGGADADETALARKMAEQNFDRISRLHASGAASQVDLDNATLALERARANIAITAPASGVVLRRDAERGQVVAAGTPVLWIGEQRSGVIVRASVASSEVARIHEGDLVDVKVRDRDLLSGKVARLAAKNSQGTGAFEIEVQIDQPGDLRSGEVAEVVINSRSAGEEKPTFILPALALIDARADQGVIFVVDETGAARRRAVFTGGVTDQGVVILQGLSEGDAVITRGASMVRDGDKVRVAAQ